MEIQFHAKKFQELALHIAKLSEEDQRFGATKLNKLLFYADFGSYRLLGAPITGASYQHLPAGPAPREWLTTKATLEDSGQADVVERSYFAGVQKRLMPNREADLSIFSPEELRIVADVVEEFWSLNARQISEFSHDEWAWMVTNDYEDIPYQLAWVSADPLTPEQIQKGYQIAQEAKLLNNQCTN